MADQGPLVSPLAQAIKEFGESRPLTWRACRAFRDVVGADGASITFENSSMARVTICVTDQSAELLDNLQDVLQEGPCQAAFKLGTPTRTGIDREAAAQWPQFIPAAEEVVGPDAVLWAIPMRSEGLVIGTISLYRRLPGPLAVTADDAQVLADAVADMLVEDPMAYAAVSRLAEEGWSSRLCRAPGCRNGSRAAGDQRRGCTGGPALVRVRQRRSAAGSGQGRRGAEAGPVRKLAQTAGWVLMLRRAGSRGRRARGRPAVPSAAVRRVPPWPAAR